ncbi:Uncharacterised protein [Aerococcus viridans]|nr:Uncharacterised protein [Aerococcus viridans]
MDSAAIAPAVEAANSAGIPVILVDRTSDSGEEKFHLEEDLEFIPHFCGNYLRGAVVALQADYDLKVGINGLLDGDYRLVV